MTPQDLRHLPPPEPMEIILDAVDTLAAGTTLCFLLPHHPAPLLPLLVERGLLFHCELVEAGAVLLTIDKS